MASPQPKRPLLTPEDRGRLRIMANRAHKHTEPDSGSPARAYAQGVADVIDWLNGEDMSDLLRDVTR